MSALAELAPDADAELMEGYQRYAALLETLLTPHQNATYAAMIQRAGGVPVMEDVTQEQMASLSSEEVVVATTIMADETVAMENRRVAALLRQRADFAAGAHEPSSTSLENERVAL
jgi:hypothetical protein